MTPVQLLAHAFAACGFGALGVVALLLPVRPSAHPLARHRVWLGAFGVLQCAESLLDLWIVAGGTPPTGASVSEIFAAAPLAEYARRLVADRLRESPTRLGLLASPWIYLVVLAALSLTWPQVSPEGAAERVGWSWLITVPSALTAGWVLNDRTKRSSATRLDRAVAYALAITFLCFGLAAAGDLGWPFDLHRAPALVAVVLEMLRALGALIGALLLGWLVGRETRQTVELAQERGHELGRVLEGLEQRVAARTDELSRANDHLAILRDALDSSLNAFCIADLEGRVQYVNPAFATLWELDSPADAIGRKSADFAASREEGEQVLAAIRNTGAFDAEVDVCGRRGGRFPARVSAVLVRAASGAPIAVMGSLLDLTETREATAALEREREFARRLLSVAPALVVVLTREGRIQHVNPAFERLTGFTFEEVRGQEWVTFLPARDRERTRALFARAIGGHATRGNVNPVVTRAGEERQIEWYDEVLRDSDGGFLNLVAVGIDVTDRLAAEARLHAEESRNQQVLDSLFGYVGVFDLDGICLHANRAPLELAGLELSDVVGKHLWDTYWLSHDADSRARVREGMESAARGETVRFEANAQVRGGRQIIVDFTFGPVRDERGAITYVVGFGVDVTERMLASSALAEANRYNQALLQMTHSLERASLYEDVSSAVAETVASTLAYPHTALAVIRPDAAHALLATRVGGRNGDTKVAVVEQELDGERGRELRELLRGAGIEVLPVSAALAASLFGGTRQDAIVRIPVKLAENDLGLIALAGGDDAGVRDPSAAEREYLARLAAHVAATLDRIGSARAHARAERAAREHESRYQRLHDSMRDAFAEVDMAGRIVGSNPAYRAMLGYSDEELARLTYTNLTPVEWHASEQRIVEEQVLRLGHSDVYEKEYRRKDGSIFPIELRAFLLRDAAGAPSGMWAIVRDVTARRSAERRLRASEERLRQAVRVASFGVFDHDHVAGDIYWSPEARALHGWDAESPMVLEEVLAQVHPDDVEMITTAVRNAHDPAGNGLFAVEYREVRRSDGELRWLAVRSQTFFAGEGVARHPVRTIGAMLDRTEAKTLEQRLRESLAEKETLVREVHHRVKNNLQIISSVLHFQAKKIQDPRDVAVLAEGRDRLRSMILVHQQLYRATDLSRLDFADYVRSLVHELMASHGATQRGISVRVEAEPLSLPIDRALPCGMVVAELLTNSFKYAFPDGRRGHADVCVRRSNGDFQLSVRDDGVGLPVGFESHDFGSFGWQLIRSLARQVGASIEIDRERGTCVSFTVPLSAEPQP